VSAKPRTDRVRRKYEFIQAHRNPFPTEIMCRELGVAPVGAESDTVSNNKRGRKLRTFVYNGQPVEMLPHLKIGVKDSEYETLRIHFMWDADARVIVIGH
jgi:hypothetical protein